MQQILTSRGLQDSSGARHAFFTRAFGNPGLTDAAMRDEALRSRARMAAALEVPAQNLLSCYQIHSPDVVTVAEIWPPQDRPRADALVTNVKGIALAVLTADCVPILFTDENAGVIGAAHAGWRGAVGGVIENTLGAMEKLGARRKNTVAVLGPCIWQKSYEVGADFPAPFVAENPDYVRFFVSSTRDDHYLFDLPGYVVAKLRALGVGSVWDSVADTFADPERFFSHRYSTLRNEARAGNLLSAITLCG